MIEQIIEDVVNDPSVNNKEKYENFVSKTEYDLLVSAENFEPKTREYFNKRQEAFSFRGSCATKLISKWVKKYNSSEGCPVTYADTLNIPFKSIKCKNDEVYF
jgi:hypothetical protein